MDALELRDLQFRSQYLQWCSDKRFKLKMIIFMKSWSAWHISPLALRELRLSLVYSRLGSIISKPDQS